MKNFLRHLGIAGFLCIYMNAVHTEAHAFKYEEDKQQASEVVYDPMEGLNRKVDAFNRVVDKLFISPVTRTYRFIVPSPARKSVHNVVENLASPITMFNALLQGDLPYAVSTFWRFVVNSTWGIGGMVDIVGEYTDYEERTEDYGQTLGAYGMGTGPYIVLPLLGPSNGRDVFGRIVDVFTDPFYYLATDYGVAARVGVTGVDTRDQTLDITDEIDRTSLDPYASMRSLYTQNREHAIREGKR